MIIVDEKVAFLLCNYDMDYFKDFGEELNS